MLKTRSKSGRKHQHLKKAADFKAGFVVMAAIAILAIAEWQRAEQESRIALARQLAAQAQSAILSKDSSQDTAVLLAIQSMRLNPSGEAAQILQNDIWIHPKSRTDRDGYISTYAFSPDGRYIASGSEKGVVRVWEISTGEEIVALPQADCSSLSLGFSANSEHLVSGCNYNYIGWRITGISRVWDVFTGQEIARMEHPSYVSAVAISSDGRFAVSGTPDGVAHVWNVAAEKEIATLIHPGVHIIYALAFSHDGQYVASGTREDHGIHVWKVSTQEETARLVQDDDVRSVAFSPDGRYVVAGSGDRRPDLRVWEITTEKEISRMAHGYSVDSVAFSPDGKYVISGNEDLTARVWDAMTGKEIARIANVNVRNVAFSPDRKYALAGDYYGNVHMWKWRPEDITTDACSRVTRNPTRAEWQEYVGNALPYQAVCRNLPIEPIPSPVTIITPTSYSTATP